MFRKSLDYFKVLISSSILIFLVYYMSINIEMLSKLSFFDITLFIIIFLSFYLSLSLPFRYILKRAVSLKSLFGLSLVSNFLNLFLPMKGGTLVRASILKKKYKVSIKKYTGISILLSVCSIFILGSFSLIILMDERLSESIYFHSLSFAAYFLSISSLGVLVFSKWISAQIERDYLSDVFKMRNIFITILSYLMATSIYILRYILIFKIFNIELDYFSISSITILHLSVGLFSILPGNLGLKELSFVGITSLYGVPAGISLVMISFDRILQILLLSIGSSLYMSHLGLKFSKILNYQKG
ncbi:lysylphosphatidylglycerol synthase domain-containing protein [Halobacteriovorax sp. JY17]|uniref:lysylphosphatidylglycerol synthase domain-containing protein n=1 Tax=Halobacteriovorax sp. JY17 TaxID=2014617 RepID=UPI000C5D8C9F|nr:lysylphosphatidylglycerol synthase domain-containing protein [Halobacteriovorax sp. JY17]PIK13641.1 MAG: hypothetical protein CES88_15740 [Halobacteriovorax sp. JY17]